MSNDDDIFKEFVRRGLTAQAAGARLLDDARQVDTLRPDDRKRLLAIERAALKGGAGFARLIREYYRDADRSERTPRTFLYLHLGILSAWVLSAPER